MKRDDITPGQVVSLVSYRDSRQGWPVLILSTDSYSVGYRSRELEHAGRTRLVGTPAMVEQVGLLTVHLSFTMHLGTSALDEAGFRAKVEKVRSLVSVEGAIAALNASEGKAWDDRDHLNILDDDGTPLGSYRLLTGLQMVRGDYVQTELDHRKAEALRASYAEQAEQDRLIRLGRYRGLAARLDALGMTGYSAQDWEGPSRFEGLKFDDMERLLDLAESAVRANRAAGIGGRIIPRKA